MNFKINGRYICEEARKMFWEDNKNFNECSELIYSCLGGCDLSDEELRKITIDIIEGRKILEGINEFDLVDDNIEIRYITDKLVQLEKEKIIKEIEEDMKINPCNYLDIFAMKKYNPYKNISSKICGDFFDTNNYEKVCEYFKCDKEFTNGGLWTLDNPKLIYDLIGHKITDKDKKEFYKKLYNHIKEIFSSSDFYEVFKDRQKKYEIYLCENKKENNNIENAELKNENKIVNDMTKLEYSNFLLEQRNYDMSWYGLPSYTIEHFRGLIDRDGNFYECGFGGHQAKACAVIETNYEKFGYENRKDSIDKTYDLDECLLKLKGKGWITIHDMLYSSSRYNIEINDNINPTKQQIDKILEIINKLKLKENEIKGYKKLFK